MTRALTNADFTRAAIPELYWRVKWGKVPKLAPYREPLRHYLTHLPDMLAKGRGLYLFSTKNGTGKTALAAMVSREALRQRKSTYFISATFLQEAVVKDRAFSEEESIYDRTRGVTLLVIDDLGKEYQSRAGYAANLIEDLVRGRVQNRRATVFTSNFDPGQLKERYSVDMASTLNEACYAHEIVGPDRGGMDWRGYKLREMLDDLP